MLGTAGGGSLSVEGVFEIPVEELRETHGRTLPAIFG